MGRRSRRARRTRSFGEVATALDAEGSLSLLAQLRVEERELRERQRVLVDLARDRGSSWRAIATALGVTPQAAHKRFREASERGTTPV
jgi:DNA invertase Pin-like site-specific DNA recombinase